MANPSALYLKHAQRQAMRLERTNNEGMAMSLIAILFEKIQSGKVKESDLFPDSKSPRPLEKLAGRWLSIRLWHEIRARGMMSESEMSQIRLLMQVAESLPNSRAFQVSFFSKCNDKLLTLSSELKATPVDDHHHQMMVDEMALWVEILNWLNRHRK